MALAADQLALALAEIGALAERRIALLTDPDLSQLPPFLTPEPGLNSGFMMPQVAAAALASENKHLAHPASVDSRPTSANQEDHVSMATYAARRLPRWPTTPPHIVAIELLAAAQGIELRRPLSQRPAGGGARQGPHHAAFLTDDRPLAGEIATLAEEILAGAFRHRRAFRPAICLGSSVAPLGLRTRSALRRTVIS